MPVSQIAKQLPLKVDRTFLIVLVVLPAIHTALAHLSSSIALEEGVLAVWPSIAIYIAAVILLGYRVLPVLWLGELLVNFTLLVEIAVLVAAKFQMGSSACPGG